MKMKSKELRNRLFGAVTFDVNLVSLTYIFSIYIRTEGSNVIIHDGSIPINSTAFHC